MRRVIAPLLTGVGDNRSSSRDLEYVRDIGLIAREDPPRIANPIYAEVAPRELTYAVQATLNQDAAWYVGADGALDMDKLLAAFPDLLPGAPGTLGGTLRLPGGESAVASAGVPAAHRQRARPHRARVRPRSLVLRPDYIPHTARASSAG